MICGKHGYCENTNGSYYCHCDQGYVSIPEGQSCVGMEVENTLLTCIYDSINLLNPRL